MDGMDQKPKTTLLKELMVIFMYLARFLASFGFMLWLVSGKIDLIGSTMCFAGFFVWVISIIFTIIAKRRKEPIKTVFIMQLIEGFFIFYSMSFIGATYASFMSTT